MFGMNEIVGRKYFDDAPAESLKVTSRFFTLQGEGPFRGHPAYFVRLSKCNLACSFCDTYFDSGEYYTYDQIFSEMDVVVEEFFKKRSIVTPSWIQDRVVLVITGGEPTLQRNLTQFLRSASLRYEHLQIESNGIVSLPLPDCVTLVVSPKAHEDGAHQPTRYLTPTSAMLERADCLKFVMCAPEQSPVYGEVPAWAHEWAKSGKQVFVSPMNIYRQEPKRARDLRATKGEGTIAERSDIDEVVSFWEPGLLDMEWNQRNHEYAADYCMRHGFILNLQIHLFASLP